MKELDQKFVEALEAFHGEHDFKFTEEQKKLLREQLTAYNAEDVESFLSTVESQCRAAKISSSQIKGYWEYKEFIDNALAEFKSVLRKTRYISESFLPGVDRITRPVFLDGRVEMLGVSILPAKQRALEIIPGLEALVDWLGKTTVLWEGSEFHPGSTKGRPPSPLYYTVLEIARSFAWYFDKPTLYMDGSFANVVRIVLEAIGEPSEDPSRLVTYAVKEVSAM